MKLFRADHKLTPSFDLINPSIKLLRENIWSVFYLMFLPSLIIVVGSVMFADASQPNGTIVLTDAAKTGIALMILGAILTILTLPGAVHMQLKAVRGGTPIPRESFKAGLRRMFPLIIAMILMEFAILGGLLLFIVPGLFLIRSYYLTQFYVIDQKLGPIKALKKARSDSKPNAGYIWGTIGVLILFSLLSSTLVWIPVIGNVLSLIVGLLYAFAPAMRYDEIKKLQLPDPNADK